MSKLLRINETDIELHAFGEKSAANEPVIEVLLLDASFAEGGDKIICKFSMSGTGKILELDDKHPIPEWLDVDVVIKEVLEIKEG